MKLLQEKVIAALQRANKESAKCLKMHEKDKPREGADELTLEYLTDGKRHLICLPYSIENLHRMADELGIKRCWFHKDHYDVPVRRRAEIEAKCRKVTSQDIVRIARYGATL